MTNQIAIASVTQCFEFDLIISLKGNIEEIRSFLTKLSEVVCGGSRLRIDLTLEFRIVFIELGGDVLLSRLYNIPDSKIFL